MHRKVMAFLIAILLLLTFSNVSCSESLQQNQINQTNDYIPVIVQASLLNGRISPSKKSDAIAFFDRNDVLQATGEWSEDHHWIEIVGGETGCVWVYADYVNEIDYSFLVWNVDYNKVKIRSRPIDGKIVGYLKRDRSIEITQVLMGWGRCSKGWINLDLVEENV